MIGSAYIQVPHGAKPLRVTALRRSPALQLVRLDASHAPNKMSRIWWFSQIELRPHASEPAQAVVRGVTEGNYWLSVLVFSNAGAGWFQSNMRNGGPLRVPEPALTFDDYPRRDMGGESANQGLILSVVHDDAGHDGIAKIVLGKNAVRTEE